MSYKNSKNNYRGNSGSHSKKQTNWGRLVAIILAVVLACSALTSAIGFMSKGFTNVDPATWFERELNEANLIKYEGYYDNLTKETEKGLKMKWKDDGSVVLSGMYEDSAANVATDSYYRYEFTSVTLPVGVYKLSAGNDECSSSLFGLYYSYTDADGKMEAQYVGSDVETITVTEDIGEITLYISVFAAKNKRFFGIQSYIRPVLVPEGASIEFYK